MLHRHDVQLAYALLLVGRAVLQGSEARLESLHAPDTLLQDAAMLSKSGMCNAAVATLQLPGVRHAVHRLLVCMYSVLLRTCTCSCSHISVSCSCFSSTRSLAASEASPA